MHIRPLTAADAPFLGERGLGLCDDEPMPRGGARLLVLCSSTVVALLAAHDVTHVLDDGLDTRLDQLALVALPQWLVLAIVMAVIVRGEAAKRQTAALGLGIGVTVGFVVVHLLPLSPAAFWDLQPSVLSWVLVWVSAAGGLLLTVLAWPRRRAATRDLPYRHAGLALGMAERRHERRRAPTGHEPEQEVHVAHAVPDVGLEAADGAADPGDHG